MLDLNLVQDLRKVITHGGCSDGLASALLIKDALPQIEVEFVFHGSEQHRNLVAEPGILFVDFSPTPERAMEFVQSGAAILDHHKGSEEIVRMFGDRGVFADEQQEPGVSGAVLAYRNIWYQINGFRSVPCDLAEKFARLVGIRDTWQRHHKEWENANVISGALAFMSTGYWMERLSRDEIFTPSVVSDKFWRDIEALGNILVEKRKKLIESSSKRVMKFDTKLGTKCILFERTDLSSDMAEFFDTQADLVVGFSHSCENNIPQLNVSTRSHTNFNCCDLSKFYGGGGHMKAAGFRVNLNPDDLNPYMKIQSMIEQFEERNES